MDSKKALNTVVASCIDSVQPYLREKYSTKFYKMLNSETFNTDDVRKIAWKLRIGGVEKSKCFDKDVPEKVMKDVSAQMALCMSMCSAIDSVHPDMLKEIEEMAVQMQDRILQSVGGLSQAEYDTPEEMLGDVFSNMEGVQNLDINSILSSVLPSAMRAVESEPVEKSDKMAKLLEGYENIDGVVDARNLE